MTSYDRRSRKIVIFGESNIDNAMFYNVIRRFLMIGDGKLESNQNNYLETSFSIGEKNYIITSTSSALFSHKSDNEINKEEKILNQELLLSSDTVYLFINIDNADLDYNLNVQKYLDQNRKKHSVVFSSNHVDKNEFESNFLAYVPIQRIMKNSGRSYFFPFLKNDRTLFQLKEFIYDEFSFNSNLDVVNSLIGQEVAPKLTIFGPPNSGKSTLLNSLLGKRRSIVSSLAGTTREKVVSLFG